MFDLSAVSTACFQNIGSIVWITMIIVQVISIVQFNSMIAFISSIIFVESHRPTQSHTQSHTQMCYSILVKFTFKVVNL